jgi:cobalt/nickel transport system permease protein
MHADAFDRFRPGDSPVHRLDPRVKVVLAVLFACSNAVLPDGSWLAFSLSLGLVLLVTLLAGLPAPYAVTRSVVALPFALAAGALLFTVPGAPLATWQVGPWLLQPTDAGLVRVASILARTLLSVMGVVLLAATTPFPDMAHALRHLRVPDSLVAILAFGYRYLFVLGDESMRLIRARRARSAAAPGLESGGSVAWRAMVTGHMAGQLFLRSIERADRVQQAMAARGYAGHLLTLRGHQMRRADWLAGGAGVVATALLQLVARLGRP